MADAMPVQEMDERTETSVDRELERLSLQLLKNRTDEDAKDKFRRLMRWRESNLVRLPPILDE